MSDPIILAVAFAGGIAGAAFGALSIFILCGLAVVIGVGLHLATGSDTFMNQVAWGPFLGPHTSFAGGVAAAAYAAWRGKLASGRDIVSGLMGLDAPDVLLVGGCFGALGQVLVWLLTLVPDVAGLPWTNTIALSITINAILVRLLFSKTGVFGTVALGSNRWTPSPTACWLPWQSQPLQLLLIGLGVGIPAAYTALVLPHAVCLIFGFAVMALIFLQYGTKIPVTHHIALAAGLFASATHDLGWGVAAGLAASFLAEAAACMFLNHGDTHNDPPTVALIIVFTAQPLLTLSGVLTFQGIVPWLIAATIGLAGFLVLTLLRGPAPDLAPATAETN